MLHHSLQILGHQIIPVYLASASQASGEESSSLAFFLEAGPIVLLVLLILVGMSVACWIIIVNRVRYLIEAERTTKSFLNDFWTSDNIDTIYKNIKNYSPSPVSEVFRKGNSELGRINRKYEENRTSNPEKAKRFLEDGEMNLQRAMRRSAADQKTEMEQFVTFLATTGSTAPFIGLFGTVWGILRAFQKIGETGNASIQTVGPDIAHALIATAVGLVAAIPAVIAYNFINRRIRVLSQEMDNFTSDFLNIIKRNYLTR